MYSHKKQQQQQLNKISPFIIKITLKIIYDNKTKKKKMNNPNLLKPLTILTSGIGVAGKSQEKRTNSSDEFNKHINAISDLMLNGNHSPVPDENTIHQVHQLIERLITNEYFRLMYINNSVINRLKNLKNP